MDPDAALKQAIQAVKDEDPAALYESIRAYREWRQKMGFEPKVSLGGDDLLLLLESALGNY